MASNYTIPDKVLLSPGEIQDTVLTKTTPETGSLRAKIRHEIKTHARLSLDIKNLKIHVSQAGQAIRFCFGRGGGGGGGGGGPARLTYCLRSGEPSWPPPSRPPDAPAGWSDNCSRCRGEHNAAMGFPPAEVYPCRGGANAQLGAFRIVSAPTAERSRLDRRRRSW